MASSEEKETLTRAHARPVGEASVSWGLKIGCRKIKMEPLNIVEKYNTLPELGVTSPELLTLKALNPRW